MVWVGAQGELYRIVEALTTERVKPFSMDAAFLSKRYPELSLLTRKPPNYDIQHYAK